MSATPDPSPPAREAPDAPIGAIVVLGIAAFLFMLMMANLTDSPGTDAAGRGLNQAFAALIGLILWIFLAVLLLIGAARGRMPLAATLAAVILLPLSAWGAIEATTLLDRSTTWPLLVPGLLVPLIAFYAMWARLPPLQRALKPLPTSLAVGLAIVVLSVLPLAVKSYGVRPDPVRDAKLAEEAKARQAAEEQRYREEREQEAAAFAKLGPDSSLFDYLPYRAGDVAREAAEGMKKVKSRQADIVVLLRQKPLHDVPNLLLLDLQPTAELCQAYGTALATAATQISPKIRSDYVSAAIELEYEVSTIRWLTANGCDLDQALTLAATNIRAVSDSDRLTKFADKLEGLRRAK